MVFLRIDWNGQGFDAFVTDANLSNGLLSIALKRELPEALKPRRIEIGTGPALIEGEAKAA